MRRRIIRGRDLILKSWRLRRGLGRLLAGGLVPLLVALVALPELRLPAPPGEAVQARVIDGDTLAVGRARLRLQGIDAPEMEQRCERDGVSYDCGVAARDALARILGDGALQCDSHGEDRYRRRLVRCRNAAGADIGAAMVAQGWALAYRRYATDYVAAENSARSRRKGLWAGQFEPPWDWRRQH